MERTRGVKRREDLRIEQERGGQGQIEMSRLLTGRESVRRWLHVYIHIITPWNESSDCRGIKKRRSRERSFFQRVKLVSSLIARRSSASASRFALLAKREVYTWFFWRFQSSNERNGWDAGIGPAGKPQWRSISRQDRRLLAKSPSPPPSVEPLRPFPLLPVSRKSRSAAISFIVQLVISTAITLLNLIDKRLAVALIAFSRGRVAPSLFFVLVHHWI